MKVTVDTRCEWCGDISDPWWDNRYCPEPCGSMHMRCEACGLSVFGCILESEFHF